MPAACPICGKAATVSAKPFCSTRCADLDLGRWLGEGYKIPVVDDDSEESIGITDVEEDGE